MFSKETIELRKRIAKGFDDKKFDSEFMGNIFAFLLMAIDELDKRIEKLESKN